MAFVDGTKIYVIRVLTVIRDERAGGGMKAPNIKPRHSQCPGFFLKVMRIFELVHNMVRHRPAGDAGGPFLFIRG